MKRIPISKTMQVVTIILLLLFGTKMCVPAYAADTQTKSVDYYDPTDSTDLYKKQDGCIPVTASTTQMEGGKWYVVDADIEISDRIIVTGDAYCEKRHHST